MASMDNISWYCRVLSWGGATLEGIHGRMCSGNLSLHQGLETFKRLWAIIHLLLDVFHTIPTLGPIAKSMQKEEFLLIRKVHYHETITYCY